MASCNVKVLCKSFSDCALGIKDGGAKLFCNDPSDKTQQWLRVWKADSQAFVLVNTATGQALCHPLAPGRQVLLVPYKVGSIDHHLLWSECGDSTDEFRAISVANDTYIVLDADQSGQRITIKGVAQTLSMKESQLWKISLCG